MGRYTEATPTSYMAAVMLVVLFGCSPSPTAAPDTTPTTTTSTTTVPSTTTSPSTTSTTSTTLPRRTVATAEQRFEEDFGKLSESQQADLCATYEQYEDLHTFLVYLKHLDRAPPDLTEAQVQAVLDRVCEQDAGHGP